MNPLAKWNREVGRTRTIARTVKQLPVSPHFPTTERVGGEIETTTLPLIEAQNIEKLDM
jgi:hypothetical protein